MTINSNLTKTILNEAMARGVTDLHLIKGEEVHGRTARQPVSLWDDDKERQRVRSELQRLWDDVENDLMLLGAGNGGSADFGTEFERESYYMAFDFGERRVRVSKYRTRGRSAFCLRFLPRTVPSFRELGTPPEVQRILTSATPGLVLVSGEPSSGKSTTLAATIDWMSDNCSYHIRTYECPIEFVHESRRCLVTQQTVDDKDSGRMKYSADVSSYARAVEDALLHDVNVMVFGEVKDYITAKNTLKAAQLNMLVFATTHATSCALTLQRFIEDFPEGARDEVRQSLSRCLKGVICQTLRPDESEPGRLRLTQGVQAVNLGDKEAAQVCREALQSNNLLAIDEAVKSRGQEGLGFFYQRMKFGEIA